LPAELPASRSENAGTSSGRVDLITEEKTASILSNTGENTAESYRWSHLRYEHATDVSKDMLLHVLSENY
jgi:hypothetical protein